MESSSFTHEELSAFVIEMINATDDPAEQEKVKAKHQKIGVYDLLGRAYSEWMHFYESYMLIKATEMHLFYEANSEKLDKELGERQREMVGSKTLDKWPDESKALAAMHACHVASGISPELFTNEQLHIHIHQTTLGMRAMEGGMGFGDG